MARTYATLHLPLMRIFTSAACVLVAGLVALPAAAAVVSSDGVVSLTPAEREAALDAAADSGMAGGVAGSRAVHGEVGMEMDSRGGHAVYGTAVMPIGSSGVVALSFLNGQYGRPFRR